VNDLEDTGIKLFVFAISAVNPDIPREEMSTDMKKLESKRIKLTSHFNRIKDNSLDYFIHVYNSY